MHTYAHAYLTKSIQSYTDNFLYIDSSYVLLFVHFILDVLTLECIQSRPPEYPLNGRC